MAATLVQIMEAVTNELNDQGVFIVPFTAVRAYYLPRTMEELDAVVGSGEEVLVTVMPPVSAPDEVIYADEVSDVSHQVVIGLQQRLPALPEIEGLVDVDASDMAAVLRVRVADDNEIGDRIVELGEEIVGFFRDRRLAYFEEAIITRVEHPMVISQEDWSRARIATRLVRLTYAVYESTD